MAFTADTKLGAYEILSPLGAGSTGEVYRAHDWRRNGEVAIKVLPQTHEPFQHSGAFFPPGGEQSGAKFVPPLQ